MESFLRTPGSTRFDIADRMLSFGSSELRHCDEALPTNPHKEHNLYFQFLSVMTLSLVKENTCRQAHSSISMPSHFKFLL